MLDPALNITPKSLKHIHILGICGTGMAALAGMLLQSGYQVTGSDSHVYPPMSDFLKKIGIVPMDGYSGNNLKPAPDLVIVGNVITRKNAEAIALAESGIPYLSFPQALRQFFIDTKRSIVISGTHGKTTTCSLMASALYHAGLEPGFMIGGIVSEFQSNHRIGSGPFFISEGDEYDTAFFDKESKFLHYHPEIAVITSIEFDHADIFADLDQIKAAFRKFVQLLPRHGLIVANLDDAVVAEVVSDTHCQVEGYGFSKENEWIIDTPVTAGKHTRYDLHHNDTTQTITIPLSGKHNCYNSAAVTAVLHHIGVEQQNIPGCLAKFGGVKRRQEVRGELHGITVIDDFAHHPSAVKTTLAGLKSAYSGRRLVAVFEPRTNTSRRAVFQQKYTEAFGDADVVLLREPIPLSGVEELFSSARLASDIRKTNPQAYSFATTEEILHYLGEILVRGDVIAILSNGGFDNIHSRLLELLEKQPRDEAIHR